MRTAADYGSPSDCRGLRSPWGGAEDGELRVTTAEASKAASRDIAPTAVVLESKLTPPRGRPEHVLRDELLAVLRDGRSRKLTLVAAPPGFGKTTLLAQWATESTTPVAWLSVDDEDNDPVRFFAHLIVAIRTAAPTVGKRALAAQRVPGAGTVEVVLPLLLNELTALKSDVALVIDDYHLITNADVHEALTYLIGNMPPTVRLLLATRADPPVPLGRMRARAELAELRAMDLRFRPEETTAFLTKGLGLELTVVDVDRLQARTEGWPAALYLAALSLRDTSDPGKAIDAFAGDDRYLVDYLTTELLARQRPEVRTFLLRTSILNRLCAPLCNAVTGRDDSADLLAEIERSNLLLVPLDAKREWYRYHHLFADLLRHELTAGEPDAATELHARAYAWYRDAGLIVDAATHAIAAHDVDEAIELVAQHYAMFVGQGQLATVIRWIDALPEAAAARDWRLCFAATLVMAHAGQIDAAEHWLALAKQAPAVVQEPQGRASAIPALTAYLRLLRGDISEGIANGRRALQAAPAEDVSAVLTAQLVLISGLWWSPFTGEAKVHLERAIRTATAAGDPATTVLLLGMRAAIALDEQDDRTAEALAREALDIMRAAELDEHPWAATSWVTHGILLGRRGDLDGAAEAIERGVEFGERLRAWQLTVFASLALAEVRQRQGETVAARRLLTRAREILEALPDPGNGLERLARTEKMLRLRGARIRRTVPAPFWELSERELAVLRLLPSGLSRREIAAELYVSLNTVKTHMHAIFAKLGVSSRAEAVERARDLGLI
jgi:LuxR family maltose regulon positive regulatory protein